MAVSVAHLFQSPWNSSSFSVDTTGYTPQPDDVVILGVVSLRPGARTVTAVSGLGATWTQVYVGARTYFWVGTGATAGSSVSVSMSASGAVYGDVYVLRGLSSSTAVGVETTTTGTALTGPSVTAGSGQAVLSMSAALTGSQTFPSATAPATDWTQMSVRTDNSVCTGTAYRVPASTAEHRTDMTTAAFVTLVVSTLVVGEIGALAPTALTGTTAATSTATGVLTVVRSLTGTAGATSAAAGLLTVTGRVDLTGTGTAVSSAAGNLTATGAVISLTGTAAATSHASGGPLDIIGIVARTFRRELSTGARQRTGRAFADVQIPVTPEPPTLVQQAIPVVVDRLPDPTVTGGVVHPLTPDTLREDTWGRVRIRVGQEDVTYFRDVLAQVSDWQLTDPYGHGPATLKFPQISFYELGDFGTGDLSWLPEEKNAPVDIDHVKDGEYVDTIWSGHIDAYDFDESGALVCDCAGELMGRMDKTHRTQRLVRRVHDAGFLAKIAVAIPNKHYHTPRMGAWDGRVGIDLENTGGGMDTNLVFLDYVLTQSVDEDLQPWTILPVAGKRRHYDLVKRDQTTVDFTVYLGARGVGAQLRDDQTEQPNRLFGEGVDPHGWRWRGAVYPELGPEVVPPYPFHDNRTFGTDGLTDEDTDTGAGISVLEDEFVGAGLLSLGQANNFWGPATTEAVEETQRLADLPVTGRVDPATWTAVFGDGIGQQRLTQGHIMPLVWAPRTERRKLAPNGSFIGLNPAYDEDTPRIERWVSFGEGVSKRRARRWLRREEERANRNNWRGTITLGSDVMAGEHIYGTHGTPMSRMDIRSGMNGLVKRFGSTAGMLMHVSAVSGSGLDGDSPSVQLAVDTQFRDYITLAEMLERDKAARLDSARQWRNQHRRSTTPSDSIIGWDREAGAGHIKKHRLVGGEWNVIPFVAGQSGEIQRIDLATSNNPAEFIMAIFALPVHPGLLHKKIGDPFAVPDGDENIFSKQEVADWLAGTKKKNRDELRADIEAQEQDWDDGIEDVVAKREKRISEQMDEIQDNRIGVYVAGTTEQPCGYWPHVKTNSNGEPTGNDVSGMWRDDAGFSFWTLGPGNPFLYLAVFPDRDCTIGGQMYDQLSEGV